MEARKIEIAKGGGVGLKVTLKEWEKNEENIIRRIGDC